MEHATESGPVNLGNEEEHSMLSLAELAHEIARVRGAPREGRISFHPRPVDDPTQRRPDLSLARRVLGFAPRVGVREGLARTAEYFASESGEAR